MPHLNLGRVSNLPEMIVSAAGGDVCAACDGGERPPLPLVVCALRRRAHRPKAEGPEGAPVRFGNLRRVMRRFSRWSRHTQLSPLRSRKVRRPLCRSRQCLKMIGPALFQSLLRDGCKRGTPWIAEHS